MCPARTSKFAARPIASALVTGAAPSCTVCSDNVLTATPVARGCPLDTPSVARDQGVPCPQEVRRSARGTRGAAPGCPPAGWPGPSRAGRAGTDQVEPVVVGREPVLGGDAAE